MNTQRIQEVEGDLLEQEVDCIVNPWNRDFIPWWLLLPQGVSGAIKKRGGYGPFREVRRHGLLPLGGAVLTGAGSLPFRGIVHVAGINAWWRATEASIRDSITNAVVVAAEAGMTSLATPLIGAGTGGFGPGRTSELILDQLEKIQPTIPVTVVTFSST